MQHRGAKWLSTSKDALHALPATDPDYKIWQDYLWEELHLAEGSQKHISQTVQTAMKHLELRGCPQKRYLNDRLQDWSFGRVKHHDIRPLMVGLDHIQDHRF
jgi:hypothetical protein